MRQALATCTLPVACLIYEGAAASEGRLMLLSNPGDGVEAQLAHGLQDRAPAGVVRVDVGSPETCCAGSGPIASSYTVDGLRNIFAPAFALIEGQTYTAVLDDGEGTPTLAAFKTSYDQVLPPTEVLAIYPSVPDIPENTLRFFIEFAAPMAPHHADEFIRLVDGKDTVDPDL
jgi:hypothetical protein